jgi:mannosyl-3-phosphoglycerate phosphatase
METRKRTAVRLRPKSRATTAADGEAPPRVVVFTSVDGTLLDALTFAAGPSRATVQRLQAAGVPIVPVSIMTLDELAPIAAELGLQDAMVIEAGGALARWVDGAWAVEACGPPAETLLDVVLDIEDRTGARLLVYSALPEVEAARVSGRSGAMLDASQVRRFSEPFLIETGELDAVARAAAEIGFSVRRGRRFLHLCRECDEGEAFRRIRDELGADVAVAVGGASVDAEFLALADVAIIVPGPDGQADAELLAKLPDARVAPAPGPDGWAAAVEEAVESLAVARRRALGA